MTSWTEAAKAELQKYFDRIQPGLAASGADAKEVMEDLRRHLDAEAAAGGLRVVTEHDLRRLLAKIGAPETVTAGKSEDSNPSGAQPQQIGTATNMRGFVSGILLFIGVILPAITLAIEAVTHMCEAAFFNPLPTIWHGLLVLFVIVINGIVWSAVRRNDDTHRTVLGWLNGAAIAIAAFYAFLFIPLLVPGAFAIIILGWGLLPWSPMLSLVAAVVLRTKLRRMGPETNGGLPGFWRGFALGLLALMLAEAPVMLTRAGMQMAVSESQETRQNGIGWLRRVGKEDILLRACYGFTRGAQNMDMRGAVISGGQRISAEQAREIYYRVTGVPFNSVPPPEVRTGRGAWNELNDWTWDEDHGGDKVGGRIRGLKLNTSRLDTVIDPDAAWSYTEWILEFRNDATLQREARAQILLPPGGVVSRLTLWVNGEEREAAFAGRSQVREAYQKIAVQQQRDPVLITTSGPDRILMQCFPVPPDGGLMKVRIGITAPLLLQNREDGIARLPVFLERNFTIPEGLEHAVWVQSSRSITANATNLFPAASTNSTFTLRGQISNGGLGSPNALVRAARDANIQFAWVKDTHTGDDVFIRQSITDTALTPPTAVIVVLDGSSEMKPFLAEIADALRDLPDGLPVTVLAAFDGVSALADPNQQSRGAPDPVEAVRGMRAIGGQDNVPALMQAWNLASKEPGTVILWIHQPQPILLSSTESLVQAMERTANGPRLFELQAGIGPDRVIEKLNGSPYVRSVPRLGSVREDLTRLFDSWKSDARVPELRRERVSSESAAHANSAVETSQHLARLWAFEEVRRLQASRDVSSAVLMAAQHQLVTPVSGAVVLENAQQYRETGLSPVSPQTVPAIPEPATAVLLFVGVLILWFRRRRRAIQP